MEHILSGCVDPNYDPCSSHGHSCSCTYPSPFPCLLREEVNRALEMVIWLGNRCHCLPPSSPKGDFAQIAPLPGDMFVLVFVTISQIGVGPVPLPTNQAWLVVAVPLEASHKFAWH